MASSYDASQYLLDRANIEDVATLMYHNFDRKLLDALITDVFAPSVTVDYTQLFGGEPHTKTRETLIGEWKVLSSKIADSQHMITGIVPDLPQPNSTTARPTKAHLVANVVVVIKSMKDNFVDNKGRMYLDLVKLDDVAADVNPWRICGIKAEIVQMTGEFAQLGKDFEEVQGEKEQKATL